MQDFPQKQMTTQMQEALFQYTEIGLRWIRGKTSFDDVVKTLGNPKFESVDATGIDYRWYPDGVMTISFSFYGPDSESEKPRIRELSIRVNDGVKTNIPYQRFDKLEIRRIVRGEKIDGVRIEQSDFVGFPYLFDLSGSTPINTVVFGYRVPLANDSPYDIEANVRFLGELVSDKGPWNVSNVRDAVNLREITIYRHYLTPEELEERKHANRWATQ